MIIHWTRYSSQLQYGNVDKSYIQTWVATEGGAVAVAAPRTGGMLAAKNVRRRMRRGRR